MHRVRFLERERSLAAERSSKYRGKASIKISQLDFPSEEAREEDDPNIERLKKLFQNSGGCDRLDFRNHIPGLIDQELLDAALQASGNSAERLRADPDPRDGYLKLDLSAGFRLKCLHGQDRVRAAEKILSPEDRRWTVDLYLSDLDQDVQRTLTEEYSCEKEPDDGEIYRKIREYQGYYGVQDECFEKRWWARVYAIRPTKGKNLKQIFRHEDYTAAFDIQMDIPGLGGGMKLSTTHQMFALKFHKPILRYLEYIGIWYKFLGVSKEENSEESRVAMQKVDRATVKALELTAPGACRAEREDLYTQLRNGQIFGAFDELEREVIWSRVLSYSTDRLIPSLFSFFKDVHYLQGPADCVKRLVHISPRDDLYSALEGAFRDVNQSPNQCIIQISKSRFVFRPGSQSDRADFGVRQILMNAMRDYPGMPAEPKTTKENLLAKPRSKVDDALLIDFAAFAYRLGFESKQIHSLIQRSTDREIARNFLLQARSQNRYRYDTAAFPHFVEQIVGILSTAEEVTEEEARDIAEIDYSNGPPKRCGIPESGDHERENLQLFLDKVHNTEEQQYDEITPFFIRRSVYFAFFGKLTCAEVSRSTLTRQHSHEQESQRLAEVESQRLAEVERQRLAEVERQRLAEVERQRQAAEERQGQAAEERQRQAAEERQRQAAEERQRQAAEERQRQAEKERLAKQERQRLAEKERLAKQERQRLAEKERLAEQERQQKAEEERQRQAAEERQRQAAEERQGQAAEERQRQAAEERQRQAAEERQRQAAEERQRQAEKERLAKQERQRLAEKERLAKQERQRLAEKERLAEQERQRLAEKERLAEQERQQKAEEERQRQAAEERQRQAAEERQRQAEKERLAKQERQRLAEKERLAEQERQQNAEEERQRQAEEERQRLAEKERLAEQERQQKAEEERQRLAEKERLAEQERQQKAEEERQRQAEEDRQRQVEQDQVTEQERRKQAENQPGKRRLKAASSVRGMRRVNSSSAPGEKDQRRITQIQLEKLIEVGTQKLAEEDQTSTATSEDKEQNQAELGEQADVIRDYTDTPAVAADAQKIRIDFKIVERGTWRLAHSLLVDPADPSEVRRVALKYMRKKIYIFDTNMRMLSLQTCFEDVIADETRTILLVPESEENVQSTLTPGAAGKGKLTSDLERKQESTLEPERKKNRKSVQVEDSDARPIVRDLPFGN